MPIAEDLRKKLTAAIKAKDLRTANLVRMLETKVMERRTAKGFKGEVNDDLYRDVIAVYRKAMAKAKDEYESYGERGREQVGELAFEIEFCDQYLPTAMSEEDARAAVRAAIAELGADNPKMAGRVVGAVMKQHKGRVEASLVQKLVGEELGG